MSLIRVFLLVFILSVSNIDARAVRYRRQAAPNQVGQGVSNFVSNGFNTVRDTVSPAIGYTADRFSQYWDRYKQTANQGINQIGQSWNQFAQNFNPQYPSYNSGQYGYNQYAPGNQQYPYPMNNNYNMPSNMYPNNGGRQGNGYAGNNYYNSYGSSRANTPYNTGGQWNQNYGSQQRSNGFAGPNPPMYGYQRSGSQRR